MQRILGAAPDCGKNRQSRTPRLRDKGAAAIPIIAVSSFAMKGDEEKARAAGCDDYVTKPYSPVQLLRVIRGFLGENS